MDNAIFSFPKPINEPVKAYAPGSSEKSSLKRLLRSSLLKNGIYHWLSEVKKSVQAIPAKS